MNPTPATDTARAADRILPQHVAGAFLLGTAPAINPLIPFLGRTHFRAGNAQTLVLTSAIAVMQLFSIFWNHFYQRTPVARYLALLAALFCLPMAAIGCVHDVRAVMVLFCVTAFGNAGQSPLNGDLLRRCYAHQQRGRVFGVVLAAQMFASVLTALLTDAWSRRDPDAFRSYLPIVAALQIAGIGLLYRVTRTATFVSQNQICPPPAAPWWSPLRELRATLKADRDFAAYEVAFMSYGVGWMIATALLPPLAADRLHLSEALYARASIFTLQLTTLALFVPFGRLLDRVGPYRVALASFAWLAIYPVGLLLARDARSLAAVTVLYAIGMTGVQLTWTLGPVALAVDATRAAHYLAIHTTLVGVRGILAQGLGMAIYAWTGSFAIPLAVASAGFAWAAVCMARLSRRRRLADRVAPTASAPG
ncbi:MAG: MFS transporter [Phycisphaerae bacterium]